MSFDDPFDDLGGGMNFVPSMFADVLKMMQTQDPSHFELVSQLALSICDSSTQRNVDPRDRIEHEELTRIAELHVADVTGMTVGPQGRSVAVHALNEPEWMRRSLERWRPTLEAMVNAQRDLLGAQGVIPFDGEDSQDNAKQMLRGLFSILGPTIMAMQIGSVIGHLGARSLGQYDVLIPGDFSDGPGVVIQNRKKFAQDWSLPDQDVALWLSVTDLTVHAIISREHIATLLKRLIVAHVGSLPFDPSIVQQQIMNLTGTMPPGVAELAEMMGTDGLGRTFDRDSVTKDQRDLETLVTVIRGYADWVTTTVADRAIGSRSLISEAITRARTERSEEHHSTDALFGVEQNAALFERGRHFVEGVIDRNGEEKLARLWIIERYLPTPAELEAPGLWLERIGLD